MYFYFLEHGYSDPDGLLPALEAMDTAGVPLAKIIATAGNLLLQRTRFGSGQVFIPDDKTHLITVFGSVDPHDDDWFASDWALLKFALGGMALTENHLACVDLAKFVKEHGPLLHGRSGTQRHVVFDGESEVFYRLCDPNHLADDFLSTVRDICIAAKPGERIVLVIVAHGDFAEGDVYIGWDKDGKQHRQVPRWKLESCLACATAYVDITIIVTSCYSGFWALPFPRLKQPPTVMAATTSDYKSMSFPVSPSGFFRGGYFPDALVTEMKGLVVENTAPTPKRFPLRGSGTVLQRALSVGDIGESSMVVPGAYSRFHAFCARLAKRFENHHICRKPQFLVGPGDQNLPAAAVLGGCDEMSTLLRVEGIHTLLPDDNFSCVALGVENITKSGGAAGPSTPSIGAAALYMRDLVHLVDGSPEDNAIIRGVVNLKAGRLAADRVLRLWRLLCWRYARDKWAEGIVRKFVANYESLRTWERAFDDTGYRLYVDIMQEYDQEPPPELSVVSYTRPVFYIATAASFAGLTPRELRHHIGSTSIRTLGPPVIPPRTSSLAPATDRMYNMGNWSSVSLISSISSGTSMMSLDSTT